MYAEGLPCRCPAQGRDDGRSVTVRVRGQRFGGPTLLYATGAAALAFTGPGAYSRDKSLGLDGLAGHGWGSAAVVAGALSGLVVVARGRRTRAADTVAQPVTAERVAA